MTEEEGRGLIATEKTFEELAREYLGDTVGSGTDDVDLDDLADKYLTDFDLAPDTALMTSSSDCSEAMSEKPASSSELKEDAAVTLVLPTALDSPNKRKSPGSPSSSDRKQRKTEILGMKDGTKEKLNASDSPTVSSTKNSNAAPETKGTPSLTQDKPEMAKQVGEKSLSGRPKTKESHSGGPRRQRDKYSRDAASRYTGSGHREQGRRGLLGNCPPDHNVMTFPENQNRNGPRGDSHDQNTSRWDSDRFAYDAGFEGRKPLFEDPEYHHRKFAGQRKSALLHDIHYRHPEGFERWKPDITENVDFQGPSVPSRQPILNERGSLLDTPHPAFHRNEYVPSDNRRDGLLDPPPQPLFNRDGNNQRNGLLDPPPPQPSFNRDENSRRNGLLDPPPPQPSFNRDENSRRNGLLDPPPQSTFNRDENVMRGDRICNRNGPFVQPQPPFNKPENFQRDGLLDPPQDSFKRDENVRRDHLFDPPKPLNRDENFRRDGLLDPPQPPFNRDEYVRRDGLLDPPQESLNRNENFRRDSLLDHNQSLNENFKREGLLDPPLPSFHGDENFRRDGLLDHPRPPFNRNENIRRDGLLDPRQPPISIDENFQRDGLLDHPRPPFDRDENIRRDGLLDFPQPPISIDENFRRDGLLDHPRQMFIRDKNFRRDGLVNPPQKLFNRDENIRRDGLLDPPQQPFYRDENIRRDGLLDPPQPPFNRDENIRRDGLLDNPQPPFNRDENIRRDGLLDPPQPPFNRDENIRRDGLLDNPQPPFNRDENIRRDGLLDPPQPPFNREENFRRDGLLDPPQQPFNREENFRRDGLLDPTQPPFNREENFRRDGLLDPPQPPFNREENFRRNGLLDPPQPPFNREENFRRDGLLDPPQQPFNREENFRRDGLLDPPQPSFNREENFRRDGLLDPPQPPFNRDENIRRDGLLDHIQPQFNREENIRRNGLLDPPQPPFNRDANIRRDGLLDHTQPLFNRDENYRGDGLLDPPHPPFSRDENIRRDGLLDHTQPPFNREENNRRNGLLDPPQPPFNRDENIRRDGLLDHTQPVFNRDDDFRGGGLLAPPHPSLNLGENMQPQLLARDENMQAMWNRTDNQLNPHPSLTCGGNDRRGTQLDPLGSALSQRDALLPPPVPVFSGVEPTPNRRGLLDPPNAMTVSRNMYHFDNRGDDNGLQACRSQPKPHLPRSKQGNGGQSVNQEPQPGHVKEPPTASCSVQAIQRKDARKPREFRRGMSVHEFVTKVVLTSFSSTRSATLTAGKYSVPVSCVSVVPPEINLELLKKLPRNIQKANTVLIDCQQWLSRGMTPLITQVSMFSKAPQTPAEVCRRTTDSLRILACTSVNISKGRRLLMRCHLPDKYGVLCRMSNPVTSSLFGDKVDEDIRSIQMGTSKIKMLNGPNEETHIPKIKTDLIREENIDENVASMVNLACTKEGTVKDLREKYKIPSNLNCMVPPKLNPEISNMLPDACVDLDTKLQDVQLSTSEAMVPGVYLLERIHEKMYNDNEALRMLTDALTLLGDAMFQYNDLRMKLVKENLPLPLQQECVWSGREEESIVPDCGK